MPSRRPVIAVTVGDPCGVGPEVIARALSEPGIFETCAPVVFGDLGALKRAAEIVGARLTFCEGDDPGSCPALRVPVVNPLPLAPEDLHFGRPTKRACQAAIRAIEEAVAMTLRGEAEAVCTAPIHKANLHRHGFPFPGHTEFLQSLTGARDAVMMLAGPRLRVALATIHCALSEVPRLLTAPLVLRTIEITGEALLRDFGMAAPRIAVSALNPHAGEDGRFGTEERDMLSGVIRATCGRDWHVSGPFPPDTVFYRAFQGEFDAVIAMYHDQGLIPLKLVHFETAVNVTLGLPIIRTSVDHGTAYDIAGTGKAKPTSLLAALRMAAEMAKNRRAARGAAPPAAP